ncbi:MAG: hypothetical protein ACLP7J_18750 [Streptosporangiaceae bacterium]
MTDLLAELDDDQRLLLSLISGPFMTDHKWPVFGYLEAMLDKRGLDAGTILTSLPLIGERGVPGMIRYGLARCQDPYPNDNSVVSLTVAGLWRLESEWSRTVCERVLMVVQYLVQRRLEMVPKPFEASDLIVRSEEVAKKFPALPDYAVMDLGQILQHEPPLVPGITLIQEGSWQAHVPRRILRYQDISNVTGYLDRASELLTPPVREQPPVVPPPLELSATIDFFNAVWQLHFDRKNPIIRLFGAERLARLGYGVATADEFSTQVSIVTDILKTLQVKGPPGHALERLTALGAALLG